MAVVIGLALGLLASGQAPRLGPDLGVLVVLSLLLEALAVPLAAGVFSAAPAVYLALALRPELGAGTAVLMALAGATARTAIHRRPQSLEGAVANLVPVLTGLAASRWLFPELGPIVYFAVAVAQGSRLYWPTAGVAASAALLASCEPAWQMLWVVPILVGLSSGVRGLQVETQQHSRDELERRAQLSDQALAQASQALEEASRRLSEQSREIQVKTEERVLLEELTQALARSPDLEGALNTIVAAVPGIVRCQSAALFLPQGQELVPASFRSPHRERLAGSGLTGLCEPTVQQCWSVQRPILATPQPSPGRLFPDEVRVAALPLGEEGVLYVGRATPEPFTDTECHLMALLGGQAALGIQSARRFRAQQEALQLHASAHASLLAWAERLAYLLERSRELAAAESAEDVLDRLVGLVQATLQQQAGLILLGAELEVVRQWPEPFWTQELLAEVKVLARQATVQNLGLLWEEGPPALPSLVIVPLGDRGALAVGSPEPAALTRDHRDMLALEAYQVASHLHKALLFQELEQSQAQLVQSSKLAAIGQLAAGVAHELNTPLGSIVMGVDLAVLKLKIQPEKAAEGLAGVKKAALTCRQIVSKLLLYSRATSGELDNLDLKQTVNEGQALVERQLQLEDIQVECLLPDGLPRVQGNPGELQQVLVNLLLNARDAGARRIRLNATAGPEWVSLTVADDGRGMDASTLERIFDPFFTTKPVGQGTGLGLTVSQQILKAHGGMLLAASTAGVGTTFTVRLKLATAV